MVTIREASGFPQPRAVDANQTELAQEGRGGDEDDEIAEVGCTQQPARCGVNGQVARDGDDPRPCEPYQSAAERGALLVRSAPTEH